MIFDGMRFTKSRKIVTLPHNMWHGENKNYVAFGRICAKSEPEAIKSEWSYNGPSPYGDPCEDERYPIYCLPVPCDCHSLTNMMYGEDNYIYLFKDGQVFVKKAKSSYA